MKRYLLFFCVVLLGLMEKSIGCSMRDSTGAGTWDFADEYLYLNNNCSKTGSCVFECGNGSGNGDFCTGGAIVYIKGKTAAYIGNNEQSVDKRAFKCTDGWSDQLWQYYDLSGLYFCAPDEIKEGKVEKIDDYDRDREIYYRVDRVNRASTSDVDWYAGDKDSFCLFLKKRLLEVGRDFYTNEEITGETDSDAENSSGSSSEVKDKSASGTEKNEEKKNSDVKSGGDETNSDTDNVKIVETEEPKAEEAKKVEEESVEEEKAQKDSETAKEKVETEKGKVASKPATKKTSGNKQKYINNGKEEELKKKEEELKKKEEALNKKEKAAEDLKKKKAVIEESESKLREFFKKVDSDRSVWKNADGSFNAVRLASDLTAGVVLGTVGGVVSGVLIKKSQVEKGFDALNCTVNGQKIADWGDEFSVGLRR